MLGSFLMFVGQDQVGENYLTYSHIWGSRNTLGKKCVLHIREIQMQSCVRKCPLAWEFPRDQAHWLLSGCPSWGLQDGSQTIYVGAATRKTSMKDMRGCGCHERTNSWQAEGTLGSHAIRARYGSKRGFGESVSSLPP